MRRVRASEDNDGETAGRRGWPGGRPGDCFSRQYCCDYGLDLPVVPDSYSVAVVLGR